MGEGSSSCGNSRQPHLERVSGRYCLAVATNAKALIRTAANNTPQQSTNTFSFSTAADQHTQRTAASMQCHRSATHSLSSSARAAARPVVLCRSAVPMHVDVAIAGAGPAGLAAAAALRKADPNLKVSQADTQADRQHLLWVWTC
jgi:hypothetical protein